MAARGSQGCAAVAMAAPRQEHGQCDSADAGRSRSQQPHRFRNCATRTPCAVNPPDSRPINWQPHQGEDAERRHRVGAASAPGRPGENSACMAKSGCQPSARDAGAMAHSIHQRGPRSAAKWLTNRMLPPGRTTRRISASKPRGCGTTEATNIATAISNEASGKSVDLGVQLAQRLDVGQPERRPPACAPVAASRPTGRCR